MTEMSDLSPTFILEPGKATGIQDSWIQEMSVGKEEKVALLFKRMHKFFDGNHCDEEIRQRAKCSRRHFRNLLDVYSENLVVTTHSGIS